MMSILLDNDVILKVCRWSLVSATCEVVSRHGQPAILGSARFVISSRIRRNQNVANQASSLEELKQFLAVAETVEPDEAAIMLAAEFEEVAQKLRMPLDGGESQLLAILIVRNAPFMVTGDKRALAAAETAAQQQGYSTTLKGRLACLEQLMATLAAFAGADAIRKLVCADPVADKSISICFSCSETDFRLDDLLAGLSSYIGHIRRQAPILLLSGEDLSTAPT